MQPPDDASRTHADAIAAALPRLLDSVRDESLLRHLDCAPPPSVGAVRELVECVRRVIFVGHFEREPVADHDLPDHLAALLARIATLAEGEIRAALRYAAETDRQAIDAAGRQRIERSARDAARAFLDAMAPLREALAHDVRAAYEGDPAARHTDETILCYPGVDAVFAHRVAHAMHRLGVPLLPRIISEQAHSRTGIDIHPGATIGRAFFIDHGTGVVIGETAVIGENVKVYQGVTIGAKSFPRDERGRFIRGVQRHPTIGDRVTIYAHAVILGGDTVIGDDCVISGAVFLTQSAPPGHIVRARQPELVLRTNRAARGPGQGGQEP
ncbi:MAG: serine acetyltransferase [Phycisphaerales bacterium]|nr:MAG: serine acetyltransferase [Phycisphaerales bacterium]